MRREPGDTGGVGVAGTAAAALGEEHHRQAQPVGQLEQPVLLLVVHLALRAGEHRVVVGQDRAARALLAEEVAIHGADARDHAVGGRARDQVLDRAAAPLRRDHQRPVLDQAAGIAEVVDVLARRALARLAPPLDRVRSRGVERHGVAIVDLLQVGPHRVEVDVDRRRFGVAGCFVLVDEQDRVSLVHGVAGDDRDAAHDAAGAAPG